jgi:hypothetical protein
MKIELNTKFNVGDKAYIPCFEGYVPEEVINIAITTVDNNLKVSYEFSPYSDSSETIWWDEDDLLTEGEYRKLQEIKNRCVKNDSYCPL